MRSVDKADNLPKSCAVVTKSGNLNFLELSGPVQACNGNALPFLPFEDAVEIQPKVRGFYIISVRKHPVERCFMGYENLCAILSISNFSGSHHKKILRNLELCGLFIIYCFYSSTCCKHFGHFDLCLVVGKAHLKNCIYWDLTPHKLAASNITFRSNVLLLSVWR